MGSASQPMLVVKANRALLKKRKFKDIKELVLEASGKTELEFKEVSPQKLAQIKAEIRRKAKEDAWKEAGLYTLCTMVVFYGLYWLFYIV
ncbi:MAG: hypothetical protein ABJN95_11550 [Maribacter sp.]|uniref:hypothetical protein n=1 Tax=Maribacter sp. TaxID=1897614 RepID=UPI003298E41F